VTVRPWKKKEFAPRTKRRPTGKAAAASPNPPPAADDVHPYLDGDGSGLRTDLTTPLGALPSGARAKVAADRVLVYATCLVNSVTAASAEHVDAHRELFQALAPLAEAMLAATLYQPNAAALKDLQAPADAFVRTYIPEDAQGYPRRRTLERGYFAAAHELLDVVAAAIKKNLDASRLPRDPKIDWMAIDARLGATNAIKQKGRHADVAFDIAERILHALDSVDALMELFPCAVRLDTLDDHVRLAVAVEVLMKTDAATVLNVARVVMHVFGISKDDSTSKNFDYAYGKWVKIRMPTRTSNPTSSQR
jgi:hypothetical protein